MKSVDYTGCPEIPFCGPVAIAAITGKPVAEVLAKVKEKRNNQSRVGSMDYPELMWILECFGEYPRKSNIADGYISLEAFIPGEDSFLPKEATFLVLIEHEMFGDALHSLVISNGMICDSMVRGIPIPIAEYVQHFKTKRAKIVKYWLF